MKKFLLPLILVLAILIPMAQVSAADITEFLQAVPTARNYARYTGTENNRKECLNIYRYEWNSNLRENFGEQYVQFLTRNGCSIVDHRVNDWRRVNAQYLDVWALRFRGQQFEVWRYKYFSEGRTSFTVRVPYSLSYGR